MKAFSVRENYLLNQLKWGYNKFATAGSTVEITNTNTTTNNNESHSESESESETQVFNEKNDIKYHDYEDEEEEDNEYDSLLKAKLLSENSYNTDLERNGNVDTTKQRRRRGRFNIKDNKNLKNPKLTIILAIVLFITCLHLLHSAFFDLGLRQPCSMKEHGHGHGHGHAHPHGYPHAHPHGHPHDHGRHHGYPHAHGDDQMDHHAHPSPPPPPHHRRSLLRQLATDLRLNNVNLSTNEKDNTTAAEIFEISLPKLIYGEPLYKQELLNYTFANSWGHPAVVDYIAPPSNINFTQVILGLSTTVDGVQYDRLAHIYLDGASIWRTSTIEPSGMLSHSYSEKDVTAYSKLFKSDGTLMFQLDNIITPRLTGAFNISLTAFYYNEKPNSSLLPHINSTEIELTADTAAENELIKIQDLDDEFDVPGSVRDFFDSNRPADQIHPLVAQPAPNRPPLVYLPNIPFKTFVPQLNFNTTKVKLQLFTSGNADEEFWYTNVLDEYKNIFGKQGHPFPGHGSCRVINVYADNYRVASLNPFPVIYTGGLSPALWRPTVSTGAFDVRALEVELTPILPLFWDQKTQLSIEIANCIDDELEGKSEAVDLETRDTDAPKPSKSGIGSNWITTANVLTWEDERIGDSDGEMLSFDNSTKVSSFGLSPPFSGNYHQFINAEYTSKINSMLNYTLYNGTQVNVITEAYFDAFQNNIISVKEFGDSQKVSFVPTSKHSFAIIDPKSEKVISQLNYTHAFPLRIDLNSQVNGPEVQYNVNITRNFKIDIDFNDVTAVQLKNKENGSSVFNLTPNGNYGFGSLEHNLTVIQSDPLPNTSYNRHSLAENGTLIYDTVELSSIDLISIDSINSNEFNEFFVSELNKLTESLNSLGVFQIQDTDLSSMIDLILSNSDSLDLETKQMLLDEITELYNALKEDINNVKQIDNLYPRKKNCKGGKKMSQVSGKHHGKYNGKHHGKHHGKQHGKHHGKQHGKHHGKFHGKHHEAGQYHHGEAHRGYREMNHQEFEHDNQNIWSFIKSIFYHPFGKSDNDHYFKHHAKGPHGKGKHGKGPFPHSKYPEGHPPPPPPHGKYPPPPEGHHPHGKYPPPPPEEHPPHGKRPEGHPPHGKYPPPPPEDGDFPPPPEDGDFPPPPPEGHPPHGKRPEGHPPHGKYPPPPPEDGDFPPPPEDGDFPPPPPEGHPPHGKRPEGHPPHGKYPPPPPEDGDFPPPPEDGDFPPPPPEGHPPHGKRPEGHPPYGKYPPPPKDGDFAPPPPEGHPPHGKGPHGKGPHGKGPHGKGPVGESPNGKQLQDDSSLDVKISDASLPDISDIVPSSGKDFGFLHLLKEILTFV